MGFNKLNIIKKIYIIDHCNIYGYGATQFLGPHSDYLLYGSVKPINRTRCLSSLGSVTTPNYRMGMFCGEGKHGVDACGVCFFTLKV